MKHLSGVRKQCTVKSGFSQTFWVSGKAVVKSRLILDAYVKIANKNVV